MVIEHELLPFTSWLPLALLQFAAVVGGVIVVASLLGFLVAAARHGPGRGLRITIDVISDGIADLTGMSWRRLRAMTWLAVKDSLRRRVVVVFALFVLFMLFAGWFLDPGSDHPARLYISVVLNWTSYLLLLLVLFLSSTSLPGEFKSQTLHTVVTKPVRASEIVLGRVLGFTVVGTILLLVMGSISYVFVVRGVAHTHDVTPADLEPIGQADQQGRPVSLKGLSSRENNHRHDVIVDPEGRGRLKMNQDHWHTVTRRTSGGKTVYGVGPPRDMLIARVPVYGKLRFVDRERKETAKGVNVGDEWTYRSYIEGGTLAAAIWTFEGVRPESFPDKLQLEMTLGVFRTYKGTIVQGIPGSLLIRNPKTGLTVEAMIFRAKEFTTDVHNISRKVTPTNVFYLKRQKLGPDQVTYARQEVEAATAQRPSFDLFDDLTDDGRMEIWLQCLDGAQYFGAAQPDVYLRARNASFLLNFVKGYFAIWMQMVLVIGFGVMFSTLLSAPVAIIATVGMFVGGLCRDFMDRLSLGLTHGGGPVESFYRILTQDNLVSEMPAGLRTTVIQMLDSVFCAGLWVIARVLPQFGDFGNADFVANGFNISPNWVVQRGLVALGFSLALFVVGYFFLKTREVAK